MFCMVIFSESLRWATSTNFTGCAGEKFNTQLVFQKTLVCEVHQILGRSRAKQMWADRPAFAIHNKS